MKLRPLVVAEKDDTVFMSSEESAIRVISPDLDSLTYPVAGQPVIVRTYNTSPTNAVAQKEVAA